MSGVNHGDVGIPLEVSVDEVLWSARSAMRRGELDTALRHFRLALANTPGDAGLQVEIADLLHNLGDLEEAAASYRGALQITKGLTTALAGLERIERRRAEGRDASTRFEDLAKAGIGDVPALLDYADALRAAGKRSAAEATYVRATELAPDSVRALFSLGELTKERGDRDAALVYFERAAEAAPGKLSAQLTYAAALRQAGSYAKAGAICHAVLARAPGHARALRELGRLAKLKGNVDEAVEFLGRAVAADPNDLKSGHALRWLKTRIAPDWRCEIEDAIATLKTSESTPGDRLFACEKLLKYGLTGVLDQPLAEIEERVPRARHVRIAARQLSKTVFSVGRTSLEPDESGRSLLDEMRGYEERPVAGAKTLVLIFGGSLYKFSTIQRVLQTENVSAVYLRDLEQMGFASGIVGLGSDFPTTITALKATMERLQADRVLAIGSSVASAGALRYGLALGVEAVLAFAPTTQLKSRFDSPEIMAKVSTLQARLHSFSGDLAELYRKQHDRPRVTIIYGENHPQDTADARSFEGISHVVLKGVPGYDQHNVFRLFMKRGFLAPMVHSFVTDGVVDSAILDEACVPYSDVTATNV
jgi:tetratricopeptide (TPR) repeat protein